MNQSLLAAILLASAVAPAAAQEAPATAQPPSAAQRGAAPQVPLDVFLEQRVAEELAADGTILSRLGVALDVEMVGDKLLVSLVDPATRRAVASTKVDTVPVDREAAVAAVTQVAANLAAQLGRNAEPAAAAAAAAATAVKQALDDQRVDRANEYRYRQEAISFGNEVAISGWGQNTSVRNISVAYQGDMRRKLEPQEFYTLVDRPDLADAYDRRTAVAWSGLIGGGVVATTGMLMWLVHINPGTNCDVLANDYEQCTAKAESDAAPYRKAGIGMTAVGTLGFLIGTYFIYHRHPVDDSERFELAAQYNAQLRTKYGLPTTSLRKPRRIDRSFVITPYASGDAGGFAVAGRF